MKYKKSLNRRYYVEYCPLGIEVSHESMNGHAYRYFSFTSASARKSWLKVNAVKSNGHCVAQAITRAELVEQVGYNFVAFPANAWRSYGVDIVEGPAYEIMGEHDADRVGLPVYIRV